MSWASAVEAIKQKFRDEWTGTPLSSVAFENEASVAMQDDNGNPLPWVYLEIMGDVGRVAGYGAPGANLVRRTGHIFVHVFTPLNTGGETAVQLAEAAAAIFALKSFSGTQCWAPHPPSPPSGDSDLGNRGVEGNWWRSYTSVPFQYDQQM